MFHIKLLVTFVSLFVLVTSISFEDWQPPTDDDVRSPCPALNSLANHGILPRDGRRITIPILVEKLGKGVNLSAETATTLGMAALRLSKDPSSGAFDLDDLKKHNGIEHDGSLSRKDFDLGGEEQDFCPEVFEETLSYYGGATEIGLKEVAAARWGRIQSSKANNPAFTYGPAQQFSSYLESAVFHQLLRNPATRKASLDWIKIFFSEERLPYEEGWRPVNHINGFTVAADTLQLALLTPEKAPGVTGGEYGRSHGMFLQQEHIA
ncbi:Peroxidase, family 2-domain-containing protein [Pyrenochaeta sp. MPI-SDFR-AT-0127]|nr:Peroxidase, family 2-domain-containing protein [Pyrenochaeta sp. MPI-SDFR-AT-0127]